ncbi:MAG: hypothetical protein EXS51_03355 [Candidatus Taylorbacteria bacterium]|nr:hypothetical protein [Candidatus Taylorbacteria bacterium]
MKILGDYTGDIVRGRIAVNPVDFVRANWSILCLLAGLEPEPALVVVPGSDVVDTKRSFPMLYFSESDSVVLSRMEFESDFVGNARDGGSTTAFLWCHLCTMMRYALRHRGIIPPNELIDADTVQSLGWPSAITDLRLKEIGIPQTDPEHALRCDDWAIQIAIMGYVQGQGLQDLDNNRITAVLCAKKSSLDRSAFELRPKAK